MTNHTETKKLIDELMLILKAIDETLNVPDDEQDNNHKGIDIALEKWRKVRDEELSNKPNLTYPKQ